MRARCSEKLQGNLCCVCRVLIPNQAMGAHFDNKVTHVREISAKCTTSWTLFKCQDHLCSTWTNLIFYEKTTTLMCSAGDDAQSWPSWWERYFHSSLLVEARLLSIFVFRLRRSFVFVIIHLHVDIYKSMAKLQHLSDSIFFIWVNRMKLSTTLAFCLFRAPWTIF